MHHDQSVAVIDGILHVMGDHHGGQMIFINQSLRYFKDFCCRFGIQRGAEEDCQHSADDRVEEHIAAVVVKRPHPRVKALGRGAGPQDAARQEAGGKADKVYAGAGHAKAEQSVIAEGARDQRSETHGGEGDKVVKQDTGHQRTESAGGRGVPARNDL